MDVSDSPKLEVGFEINFGDAFAELLRFNNVIDEATSNAIKDFTAAERAMNSVNVGGATASVKAFGNAYSAEAQKVARDAVAIEKSGEGIVRQLERQNGAFGKSRSELRQMKSEEMALAADRVKNGDLARRIREQEALALGMVNAQLVERNRIEAALQRTIGMDRPRATDAGASFSALAERGAAQEAAAANAAATATSRRAREHEQLAAAVRGSQAAQEADAAAAERLRMATDPLYASTSRLNAEIAESTRLYYAGATAPAEYARQQQVLTGQLQQVEQQHNAVNRSFGTVGTTGKLAGHHMQNLAFQFQDLGVQMAMAAQSGKPLQMAMMALMQQGTQIQGIMSQAGIGFGGVIRQFGLMLAPFAPMIAAAGLLSTALLGVKQAAASDVEMKKFAAGLGLTKDEMEKLKDVSVTWGDSMGGVWDTLLSRIGVTGDQLSKTMKSVFASVGEFGIFSAGVIAGAFFAGFRGIARVVLGLPAIVGEGVVGAANLATAAIEKMVNLAIQGINGLIEGVNGKLGFLGVNIGTLGEVALKPMQNKFAGASKGVIDGIAGDFKAGFAAVNKFADDSSAAATQRAQKRVGKQAAGIIDDRADKAGPKPRVDRSGESLARELLATEALIKGNYDLAAAYQVSDAAAFEAEIRAKATSEAIKKKADVEAYVAQQMRLAVSQRAVDGGKAIAELAAQSAAQRQVNDAVSAGTMSAEEAQAALRTEAQLRPLLVAQAVAEGEAKDALAGIIARLRGEQAAANVEASRAKVLADTASATDQLERLQVEASLINATNKERAVTLAQLEVEQFLRANPGIPADEAATYRSTKVAVAGMSAELSTARSEADLLLASMTAIADQTSVTAEIMSSAFGNVGSAIGGVMENLANYQVQKLQLDAEVKSGAKTQEAADKALGVLQSRNTAQAIAGAKSLVKEKSTGYKVMQAIEMAYAAFQTVNTIRSIAMDTAKTGSSIANSGARAAADGVAAIAKAIASLPFPLNIAAGAATAAALLAVGVKVFGGSGGGASAPAMPSIEDVQAAQGAGSVLGDSKAKSESIARSLEIAAANSNRDLEYSNGMLKALVSIDTGISQMAGTIARQISVSGSLFDTAKLGLGETGSGGFLGIGKKSTTRSLYDAGLSLGSASVAEIIANGISGSTYQTVEQIKKKSGFLGIGGGTKTSFSTTTGALDGGISAAIADVLASLRNGLVSAAGVVGLEGAQAMLDGFTVSLGKISFKGMTGEQIEEQLNAIFSSVGDQMAGAVLPALAGMQQVGEGLFETFIRVARQYEVVDVSLRSIGKAFGAVGVESITARDALVQLFGGLNEFTERTAFFRDNFLSEAEQIAPVAASVRAELARLGLAGIATRDQFKQAVLGIDLTTAAGREMYASLLAVAPGFDKVIKFFDQASKATADGLKATADQFGAFVTSLTKYRESLFAAELAQGDAYGVLRARFTATAKLAGNGDAAALGGLEASGKAFLDAARNNASTREDYLRDVAVVARGVDAGIFAADAKADYAKLQLDALKNAVSILGTIDASTAATAAALGGAAPGAGSVAPMLYDQVLAQAAAVGTVTAAGATDAAQAPAGNANSSDELRLALVSMSQELAQLRADNNAGHAATAGNTGRMARKLDDVTAASGGDAFAMAPIA